MIRYRYNDLKGKLMGKDKNSNKLNLLNWILGFAILLLSALVIIYFYFIFGLEDSEKGNWGTFGDFIGGTLNPIFALFSLFAIIYTIKIQTEELELSRQELSDTKQELKESRIAQQEQSESLKLQNEATKLQMFENSFFQLLDEHNKLLNIILDKYKQDIVSLYRISREDGWSGTTKYVYYDENTIKSTFKAENERENILKSYFMLLYQVLKFIDEHHLKNKIDGKQYTNIIRTLLNEKILRALAVNCLGYKYIKYKEYIERYSLFEHMGIKEDKEEYKVFIREFLSEFDIKAFGKNDILIGFVNVEE